LQRYGDGDISGLIFTAAGVRRGMESAQGLARPGIIDLLPGLMSTDLAKNLAATREFVINCTASPPSDGEREKIVAFNMMTPPFVREAMFSRALDFLPMLANIQVPSLVIHGIDDNVIDINMSNLILGAIPGAQKSFFEGTGHAPFREDPDRFNRELATFVRSC
jgi:pimeloyl-ACP methyl ester carboxylesterase